MKIGIDIHGVIDKHRVLFSALTQMIKRDVELSDMDHEVHILTGPSHAKLRPAELTGIWYTHFFSIVDALKDQGETPWYKEEDTTKSDPWFDNLDLWNRAKGIYAAENNLDLMIDDTAGYAEFFTTPIAILKKIK